MLPGRADTRAAATQHDRTGPFARVHLDAVPPARSEPMERLLLLDGNGLIYRGYYALIEQPLTTSKGELVTAVFGFTNIVLRAIQDVQPDRVAIAFDLPARTFRHDRYAEYKATRTRMPDDMREQIPKVKQVVRAMGIPEYEQEGFEADDAIATLVGQAEALGFDTTILTGDLDMLQLVSEHTKLMVSLRGGIANTVAYDLAKIEERWGLRPDQMLDYKSLKGDPTDNIPGIPGVGEKTASKLIATWETLDALYAHIDEVVPEKLRLALEEHRESVLESRELMRLVRDVDVTLDPTRGRVGDYDRQEVVRLFREYEFRTLIDRLPPLIGERPEDAIAAMRELREAGFPAAQGVGRGAGGRGGAPVDPGSLQLSMDFDVVSGGGGARRRAGAAAPSPRRRRPSRHERRRSRPHPATWRARWRPRSWTPAESSSRTRPVWRRWNLGCASRPRSAWRSSSTTHARSPGRRCRSRSPARTAGSSRRTVPRHRPRCGTSWRPSGRTSSATTSSRSSPRGSARTARRRRSTSPSTPRSRPTSSTPRSGHRRSPTSSPSASTSSSPRRPPASRPRPSRASRPCRRVAVRPSLDQALRDDGVDRLFEEIELPLIPILARMEAAGIALDQEALGALEREFATEITRLEGEIYAAVGHQFTIGSPKQLGDILFVELGLPKGRKTKTGYSTDASVLEELRGVHPVIEPVLDWRIYTKLRSTYVEALPTLIGPDGRLHTLFHQAVAATGRLSSSDPNLQNIPIRTPLGRRIRHAFVAGSPDTTLVAADYSQIELRILAHVSGDDHLADAFAREADIHRETAARVLRKDPADVTSDERSMAKMVNFGLAYGMSDFGLSSRAGISRQDAQEFINSYFAAYGGISRYMHHIRETAREQGYVATLLGRKRRIPELEARNPSLRAAGERMAINMPIQGTAADIVKIAMIRTDRALREGSFRARVLLSVHDELLLEAPRDEVDRLIPILREAMEGALPLSVPLTVEVKVGDSWEGMAPVSRRDAVLAEAGEAPEAIGV